MSTPREVIAATLPPLLPSDWVFVPVQRNLDTINQTTVMLRQSTIERQPEAPLGAWKTTYTLVVVEPATDPDDSEPALDDDVFELLTILQSVKGFASTVATKVAFQGTNLAYSIDFTTSTTVSTDT